LTGNNANKLLTALPHKKGGGRKGGRGGVAGAAVGRELVLN